ncbi:invasion associated locus B family protein [Methylonatrum kenyense]|uniref:invasion associated locus B family protein n=1 Tax=Methylonatrum kenyense TaxID=455253 RepID=UPI0020BEDB07|nr:invasion associated locus B family protein [Methylonatrum kenyense]MCK8517087.1 invasion associated locus B family protein [Methylonatrum kenyense]
MKRLSTRFALAVALAVFGFGPAVFAQQDFSGDVDQAEGTIPERDRDHGELERFEDWNVYCEDFEEDGETIRACEMLQRVTVEETGEIIMEVVVGYMPERGMPMALFSVPLGIRLQPGLELKVDDNEAVRIGVDICGEDGCMASMLFDDDMLEQFRQGAAGTVTIRDARNQSFDLPISMMGFTAALNRIME